ncbi:MULTISPECIES: hypothetical protein [Eikenella]|uniref:Uncharacterized protein n=1 Tax=Eikenella exigua TaxID=2528037 RepID=A0AAX1F6D6_9NEIS|nr:MULTISPECIES: hypothetical protein [Eikenella]OAM25990.1 hypothetical protein A7P94_08985 [Eikenella sp. NML01-A-086]OAM40794.1 hypothetical protein A7Q02_05370 [Eikenella sp. NML97-A-109]QED91662.1 hypothetical protein EZJ17_02675 [Eikenella exigua]
MQKRRHPALKCPHCLPIGMRRRTQLHLVVAIQQSAAHAIQLIPTKVDLQTMLVKQDIALASSIIKGYLKTSSSSFQVAFSHSVL